MLLPALCRGTQATTVEAPVAIVAASFYEIKPLEDRFAGPTQEAEHLGFEFESGSIEGLPVVVTFTGVGKTNAAAATAMLIEHYRPRAVVMIGIAGAVGPEVGVGDVVVATHVVNHDHGRVTDEGWEEHLIRNPADRTHNPTRFEAHPAIVEALLAASERVTQADRVAEHAGVIGSGDAFIASVKKRAELAERLEMLAVDMETSAVAQLCHQQGVPFAAVRVTTDGADGSAQANVRKNMNDASKRVAQVAALMLREFPKDLKTPEKPAAEGETPRAAEGARR